MNPNIKIVLIWIFVMVSSNIAGQANENQSHAIGINLLQIPATTLDLTYELAYKPRYTVVINTGYTVNYADSFDFIGFLLSPHYKCGNDGYAIKKLSGGFLKIGMKYNFRNTTAQTNYFFFGAFLTNAMIYENAEYENWDGPNGRVEYLDQRIFVFGLTAAAGYNFRISGKLHADFGLHMSMPEKNYKNMYGYSNYIPGMGYMETCGKGMVFPMIVLNLKYSLR